jgi:predicted ATPase/class 3 adenylate cyclase
MARDIGEWLEGLGLGGYAEAFADNEIDLHALPHITDDDLKEIGVALGARRKLLAAIDQLGDSAEPAAAEERSDDRSSGADAERRQLTMMFVDLVGSTELSVKLDPEDLREVMRGYQDAVAGAVTRYGGHVAKYLGDGVLAYFGWPQAHEDQAERAVRAGLDATTAVGGVKLEGSAELSARAGIATGQVVIGDIVGEVGRETEAVTGETPNLAARLQGVGEPGQVVVGDATRRLIGEAFELNDLGAHKLKGFTEPVPVWRVVGESPAESRFEAGHRERLTPLVGREHEIALLLDRWDQAKCGEGQVVLLSGGAGIGKSRIAQASREQVAQEPHTRLRYQCAPYFNSTALYPFIRQMEFAAGFSSEDDVEARLDKIENLLARSTETVAEVVPLVAAMLSVPTGDRYPPVEFTPQRQREKTLEALTDQLLGLAGRQPVFVIFEDAQWADPTTLETLEQMIDGLQRSTVLLVITFRPDFEPPWHGHTHVTTLTLNRLARDQCAAMIDSRAGGKTLPSEVLHQIVARTDGVPLFVEELTKTVLESELLRDAGDHYALCGPLPPMAIPSTLRDSLMARLDRVPAAREVAQEAAVIGREFSYGVLAAVSVMGEDRLCDILGQLVEFELIFCRGRPPDATYAFKHSLVQEAAYESLLKAKRQVLHDRIATVLQQRFPSVAEMHPEILAHHYTRAGNIEAAIPCWRNAGQRASERVADREAIEHFGKALQLIKSMPEGPRRLEQELELYLALGPALMNAEGTASDDVRRAYSRAKDLAERAQRPGARFTALWGLWLNSMIGGRLDAAQSLAGETLAIAEELADPDCLLQAHHASWSTSIVVGDLAATRYHAERGSDLYDVERHRSHAYKYGGHDPGICAASDGALVHWMLGYPDRAIERVGEAVWIADQISHAHSTAHAYCYAGIVHLLRGEADEALAWSEKLRTHSEALELELWAANAKVLRGWALAGQGRTAEGLSEFQEGVERRDELGATPRQSLYLASLALALRDVGSVEKAHQAIGRALETADRAWDPYIHWAHGMVSRAGREDGDAEAAFETALQLAREQLARSWELRAATSLASLWRNQGKMEEARGLLAPIYRWFTEGFGTQDLNDAKALLDELS